MIFTQIDFHIHEPNQKIACRDYSWNFSFPKFEHFKTNLLNHLPKLSPKKQSWITVDIRICPLPTMQCYICKQKLTQVEACWACELVQEQIRTFVYPLMSMHPKSQLQAVKMEVRENQSHLCLTAVTMGTQTRLRSTMRFHIPWHRYSLSLYWSYFGFKSIWLFYKK